jgi:hypothetical protein
VLDSPALRVGAARLAESSGTSQASVILAVFAALLAGGKDLDRFSCILVAANRRTAEEKCYSGPTSQGVITSLDLRDSSFDEFMRSTFYATLRSYRHGRFDPAYRDEITSTASHQRGVDLVLGYYNFEQPDKFDEMTESYYRTSSLEDLQLRSKLDWTVESDRDPAQYYLRIRLTSESCKAFLFFDTSVLPPRAAEALLSDLERSIVRANAETLTVSAIRQMSTAYPPSTIADRLVRVDNSLVCLDSVARVVADAADCSASRVGVFLDGSRNERLVAYLASDTCPPLVELHQRCLKHLRGHGVAMAPQWYVLCERAPQQNDDLTLWGEQPIRSQGSGRAFGAHP